MLLDPTVYGDADVADAIQLFERSIADTFKAILTAGLGILINEHLETVGSKLGITRSVLLLEFSNRN